VAAQKKKGLKESAQRVLGNLRVTALWQKKKVTKEGGKGGKNSYRASRPQGITKKKTLAGKPTRKKNSKLGGEGRTGGWFQSKKTSRERENRLGRRDGQRATKHTSLKEEGQEKGLRRQFTRTLTGRAKETSLRAHAAGSEGFEMEGGIYRT